MEDKMNVRKVLVVGLLLTLILSACAGGKKSTEVNLYAWSEYIPQALIDGFTEKTGIKVNYDAYSSNEELLAKIQAGASGYDVIIPSDYVVTIMINQGLLAEMDKSKITNFSNLSKDFIDLEFDKGN